MEVSEQEGGGTPGAKMGGRLRALPDGPPLAKRVFITVINCLGFAFLGASISVVGPCLVDFAVQTDTTLEQVAVIYTSRFGCYLASSMLLGSPCDRINRSVTLFASFTLAGAATVVAPWCPNLLTLCIALGANGMGTALGQIGCSTECLELWGRRSEGVMQAFLISLSAFSMLAPLAARPFLYQPTRHVGREAVMDTNGSQLFKEELPLAAKHSPVTMEPHLVSFFGFKLTVGRAMYPCIVVGVPLLLVAIVRLVTFMAERGKCTRKYEYIDEPKERPPEITDKRRLRKARFEVYKKTLVFVTFFLVGVVTGAIELLWSGFSAGYAVRFRNWTGAQAVLVPFVYWCAQTVVRLLVLPVARLVQPSRLFAGLSLCLLISAVVMVVMTDQNPTVLLVISGCTGAFSAPLIGAGVSWVSGAHRLTGLNSSIFYAGSSLGSMLMPVAVSKLCASLGAQMFMYMNVVLNGAMFVCVVLIAVATFKRPAKTEIHSETKYELTVNESESEL